MVPDLRLYMIGGTDIRVAATDFIAKGGMDNEGIYLSAGCRLVQLKTTL